MNDRVRIVSKFNSGCEGFGCEGFGCEGFGCEGFGCEGFCTTLTIRMGDVKTVGEHFLTLTQGTRAWRA
jgi:hypothetical protein